MGLSNEDYFLGDFLKISLGPPFAFFQKMRVLGELAKIALLGRSGTFGAAFFPQNLLQSLPFKCLLIRG